MTDAIARHVIEMPVTATASDRIILTLEDRQIRRKRLRSEGGIEVLVDLAQAVTLAEGQALALTDGRLIAIVSAEEPLLEVRAGPDAPLHRLAWHIGNRHAPCVIEGDRLLVRREKVMAEMLTGLGAELREIRAVFAPEGGAYGGHPTGNHGHQH